MIYEKRYGKTQSNVGAGQNKEINLAVAIPNDLPFRPIDVCPRWEIKEFFDENDRLIGTLMPPSYKSRSFEISYFAKIRIRHDNINDEPGFSAEIPIRFEQCIQPRITLEHIEDDFDLIDFHSNAKELARQQSQVTQQMQSQLIVEQIDTSKPGKQAQTFAVGMPGKYTLIKIFSDRWREQEQRFDDRQTSGLGWIEIYHMSN